MDAIESGKQILAKAEESLRKLVAEAAEGGQYDAVVTLADWAKALRELGSVSKSPMAEPKSVRSAPPPVASLPPKAGRNGRAGRAKKYPQFFREKDSLVKVAWSKSSRLEYEHKAPWPVTLQLVSAVADRIARSHLISMEQVLPLRNSDGEEVPSYQSYLCLAWLRELGLVRQHGRQGYSVKPRIDLRREATMAWEALSARNKA